MTSAMMDYYDMDTGRLFEVGDKFKAILSYGTVKGEIVNINPRRWTVVLSESSNESHYPIGKKIQKELATMLNRVTELIKACPESDSDLYKP